MRAIYDGEEGTEDMVCPPALRESLAAADELREKYMAVPDETLARWVVWQRNLEEGESHEVEEALAREADAHGITEGLMRSAVGPDAEEVREEERARRLREILADLYHGEKGYRVQQRIEELGAGGVG